MSEIEKLPEGEATIGARQVTKGVKEGNIKTVVVASNCPDFLLKKVEEANIQKFAGNQKELGTKLGKPFPVAMAGYK